MKPFFQASKLRQFTESPLRQRVSGPDSHAHCGFITGNVETQFIGYYPPAPADVPQSLTVSSASSAEDKTLMSSLISYFQLAPVYSFPVGGAFYGANNYGIGERYLTATSRWYGKQYNDVLTLVDIDFNFTRTLDPRNQLVADSYVVSEEWTNLDDGTWKTYERNLTSGFLSESQVATSFWGDVNPNWENPSNVWDYLGGTVALTAEETYDEDGRRLSLSVSLTINLPAAGSDPAYSYTLEVTYSNSWNRDDVEAHTSILLDWCRLYNITHRFTEDDSIGEWASNDGAGGNYLTWGGTYGARWSSYDDEWPNRPVAVENSVGNGSPAPTDFMRECSRNLWTECNTYSMRKSRVGVAYGDSACLVVEQYGFISYDATKSLLIGENPTDCGYTEYFNCYPDRLSGGNYLLFADPQQIRWVGRRYQNDNRTGTVVQRSTDEPECYDVLNDWDGSNPLPAGRDDECCWPDPP